MASTIPEPWPFVPPNLSSWKRQSCRKTSISRLIKSEQYCQSHLFTSVVQYYQYSPFWSFLHICGQGPLPSAVDMSTATAASLRLGARCQFKWAQDAPGCSRASTKESGWLPWTYPQHTDASRTWSMDQVFRKCWIFQSEKTMLLCLLLVNLDMESHRPGQIAIDHDTMNVQKKRSATWSNTATHCSEDERNHVQQGHEMVCCSNLKRCVKRIGINESHHSAGCNLIFVEIRLLYWGGWFMTVFPIQVNDRPNKKHVENANSIQPSSFVFLPLFCKP